MVFATLGCLTPALLAIAFGLGLWYGHRKGRELQEVEQQQTAREALTLSDEDAAVQPLDPDSVEERWPEMNDGDSDQ